MLCDVGARVANQVSYLFDFQAVSTHDRDETVPQLPWRPVGTETSSLGDLVEFSSTLSSRQRLARGWIDEHMIILGESVEYGQGQCSHLGQCQCPHLGGRG